MTRDPKHRGGDLDDIVWVSCLAWVALLLLVLLSGCAQLAPLRPDVAVPIAVPCVRRSDVPDRPSLHADRAWQGADEYERVRALLIDRKLLLVHAQRLEAVLIACADQGTPP